MSLMTMRRKMASKKFATTILWILVVVFLLGVVLWSVPKGAMDPRKGQGPGSSNVIALVDGQKVTAGDFNAKFTEMEAQYGGATLRTALDIRKQVLEDLLTQQLNDTAMRELRVRLGGREKNQVATAIARTQLADLRQMADEQAKQQQTAAKTDKKKPKSAKVILEEQLGSVMTEQSGGTITKKRATEKEFSRWFINDFLLNTKSPVYSKFEEMAKNMLIGEGFAEKMPENPFTPEYLERLKTKEVRARWIFVAAPTADEAGLAAARKTASELRKQVKEKPASFAELAKKNSSDAMTASAGGVLKGQSGEWVSEGGLMMMPLIVESTIFSLDPEQISPLTQVSMPSFMPGQPEQVGYAIILVDGQRERKAADKAWKKDKELALLQLEQKYAPEFAKSYLTGLRLRAKIVYKSKELKAYEAQKKMEFTRADKLFAEALNDKSLPNAVRAAISYNIAMKTPDMQKRIDMLLEAVSYAGSDVSDIHYELGRAYIETKNVAEAKNQFQYAEMAGNEYDTQLRENLRAEYKKLGDTASMKRMDAWLKEHAQPVGSGNFTMPPR